MLTKDNNYKVMKLFFDSPEKEFHIRQISRLTGLSPPGVIKILKKLKKSNLISFKKGKVVDIAKANKTERFLLMKRFYNILSLYDSGLIDYLKEKYEEPKAIVLFGSYSRGEDISISDIDIAVITKKFVRTNLLKFEKFLKRKINIHEVDLKECEKEFINSLANGIVLYGYLEVHR